MFKQKLTLQVLVSWLIVAFTFLIPWQARYIFADYSQSFPLYGGLSLYVLDLLFLLIVLAWGIWVYKNKNLRLISHYQKIIAIVFLLIILVSGLSIFWSIAPIISFWKWLRVLQAVILILIIATFPLNPRVIFLAFVASGALQGIWALGQFLLQDIGASTLLGVASQNPQDLGVSVIEYNDERWLRAYGVFPHPNILGAYLTIAGICVSGWFFSVYQSFAALHGRWKTLTQEELKPYRIQIIASLSSFVFIILGLLLSFSRAAWLGFAIGWLLLFVVLIKKTRGLERKLIFVAGVKLVAFGAILLISLSVLIGPLWTTRVESSDRLAQDSFNERSLLFNQSQEIINKNKVVGTGVGAYQANVMNIWPGQEIYSYQPVHNVWLLLWAELGVFGLGFFALWMAMVLFWLRHLFIKSDHKVDLNFEVVLSVLLAIGVMAYFEHFWWSLAVGSFIFSIWIGLYLRKNN